MKACSGDCKVINTYASKKNTVRKVECGGELYVVKKYSDEFVSGLRVEEDVLKMCMKNDIPVPRCYGYTGHSYADTVLFRGADQPFYCLSRYGLRQIDESFGYAAGGQVFGKHC